MPKRDCRTRQWSATILLTAVLVLAVSGIAFAQDEEFDQYKFRITGFWLHSSPSVSLEAAGHNGLIDFTHDLGFDDYSTFIGKVDWKFTRKNHLYFVAAPFVQSKSATLNRTIVFRGQTFNVGSKTRGELSSVLYAPGYQYDIIRRKRGHLGIAAQINLFDTTGKLSAEAQVVGPSVQQGGVSSSASLLAPIPIAGPEFRLYLTNSPRLFIEGNIYGMYLFGYGHYYSTAGDLGFALSKHFSINAGYAIGSRLNVKTSTSTSRNGLRLSQQGPLVGVELSF
jgi:hypothetical protein